MNQTERQQMTLFDRLSRWFGLFLLAPLLFIFTIPVAVHISKNPDFGLSVRHLTVVSVDPGGPAEQAGICNGDRLLGVDHKLVSTMVDYFVATAANYDFQPRSYLIRRDGTEFSLSVFPRPPSRSRMIWGYSLWVAGLAFLLMGWWVLSRRNDPVTRNFFVLSLIFAFFLADIPDLPSSAYMTSKEIVRDLMQLLWPVFFLRFFLHFPSLGTLPPPQKTRNRLLLVPVLPLFLLSLYAQAARLDPASSKIVTVVQNGAFVYFMVYFIAGLVIFARKVLRKDRPIQHTKMRVVLFGLVGGLTPFLAGAFLGNVFPNTPIQHWEWLGFSLLLVPFSFGLAILRYGALDTAFVIRYSLTYGSLTLLLLLFYFVVVVVMGNFLATYFQVSSTPLAMVTIAGSALTVMPARRKLQGWIDQAFYPARRANREAIEELGHELSGLLDSQNAAETLLTRLADLYRPERLSLFLTEEKNEQVLREVAGVCDQEPVRPVFTLPHESSLAHFLNEARRPVFAEEFEELRLVPEENGESASFLARLGSELLVPLITGNQLSGFLAFGPKGSGALYTQDDLSNLRFLALQAAALLESRRLYQESLARKQLETELTVAQEIQAQLLPTEPLVLPGIRVCGRMESCREVGGDYFDYFPLDHQSIGFAIADVAGKGIPAALLMTSLRVTFRSEAVRNRRPEEVVSQLNHAVDDLTASGQFISFFYGVLSIGERQLSYCNSGMNPPLLFRRKRQFLETLKKGGPVLGVSPDHRFRSGTLGLEEGDLLLLYTDGLTEERNQEGEFFELDRLVAVVKANLEASIEEIRETIFAAVSDFGGPNRSDDRTVMLLKINSF